MNTLFWKGKAAGFSVLAVPGLGFTMVGVNLASGWDEFPHDCTENMEILAMGFYRLEHVQSKISWEKFRQATAKIMKDKYGRNM